MRLFATPNSGKIRFEQHGFLDSAQKEKIQVNELAIQTYIWKRGEKKVLLVHGWESNTARWHELIDQLITHDFTVISLDAPAHGDSDGDEINVPIYGAAINRIAEQFQPDYAIGHSLGGTTLLYQYYRKPIPGVKKMVLLAPASELINLIKGFKNTLGLSKAVIDGFEKAFKAKYDFSFSEFSMVRMIRHFSVPCLFIHDRLDRIVSYKESVNVVESWKSADLIVTEGLGHGLKDDGVYQHIFDYLKED